MNKVPIALMTLSGLALAGVLASASPAAADHDRGFYYERQGWHDRINQRQAFQERRIQEGFASGALTYREARYLEREQAMIRRMKANAGVDGFLSWNERRTIVAQLDRADRDIEHLMHNRAHR